MKKPLVFLITRYQKYISPSLAPSCRFYPSCSEYSKQVIMRFGALRGCVLALWRILRCNPWCRGGIDYPPEKFTGAFNTKHRLK